VTLTVTGVSALNVECPDVKKKSFVIKPIPVASFTAPPACEEQSIVFTNRSFIAPGADPIVQWEYNFGDKDTTGNRIVKNNPSSTSHLYKTPGSYVAVLTVTAGIQGQDPSLGCVSDPQFLQINVLNKPNAEFGMTNNPAVVQEPIYFSDFSTPSPFIKAWYWQFGDDAASSEQAPSHAYQIGGLYTIILTITDEAGCQDTATKIIDVSLLPQVAAAFSPNGDGTNDVLHVKGGPFQSMVFRIYNNWGQLLFETSDQTIGWDGKWNGVAQPNGVYVWTLVADMYNNRQVKKNGDVTIIR
jgi:gliding motility-associated-like protein